MYRQAEDSVQEPTENLVRNLFWCKNYWHKRSFLERFSMLSKTTIFLFSENVELTLLGAALGITKFNNAVAVAID